MKNATQLKKWAHVAATHATGIEKWAVVAAKQASTMRKSADVAAKQASAMQKSAQLARTQAAVMREWAEAAQPARTAKRPNGKSQGATVKDARPKLTSRWVKVAVAAGELGIPPSTLGTWCRQGRLTSRMEGRSRLVDINALLRKRESGRMVEPRRPTKRA